MKHCKAGRQPSLLASPLFKKFTVKNGEAGKDGWRTPHPLRQRVSRRLMNYLRSLYMDKDEATVEDCAAHCDEVSYCLGFEFFKAKTMCRPLVW